MLTMSDSDAQLSDMQTLAFEEIKLVLFDNNEITK